MVKTSTGDLARKKNDLKLLARPTSKEFRNARSRSSPRRPERLSLRRSPPDRWTPQGWHRTPAVYRLPPDFPARGHRAGRGGRPVQAPPSPQVHHLRRTVRRDCRPGVSQTVNAEVAEFVRIPSDTRNSRQNSHEFC